MLRRIFGAMPEDPPACPEEPSPDERPLVEAAREILAVFHERFYQVKSAPVGLCTSVSCSSPERYGLADVGRACVVPKECVFACLCMC